MMAVCEAMNPPLKDDSDAIMTMAPATIIMMLWYRLIRKRIAMMTAGLLQ